MDDNRGRRELLKATSAAFVAGTGVGALGSMLHKDGKLEESVSVEVGEPREIEYRGDTYSVELESMSSDDAASMSLDYNGETVWDQKPVVFNKEYDVPDCNTVEPMHYDDNEVRVLFNVRYDC